MCQDREDNYTSGFVFGLIIGIVLAAVVAVVIYKNDKNEIVVALKKKINSLIKKITTSLSSTNQASKASSSPKAKAKTVKPKLFKKPKLS